MNDFKPQNQPINSDRVNFGPDLTYFKDRVPRKVSVEDTLTAFGLEKAKGLIAKFEDPQTEGKKAFLNGSPVVDSLEIPSGKYTVYDESGSYEVDFEGITIPTVIFDVSQRKNIVKTQVQGRNGTVKEYVSDGDYNISIRGVLASNLNGVRPEEDIETLANICQVPEQIEVISQFLEYFGISTIVIESFSFPSERGFDNIQPFVINAISDEPLINQFSEDVTF